MGAHHPSIWTFIEALQKEQSMNELKIEQFIAGQPAPPGRKKYRDCAERIRRIVLTYDNQWLQNDHNRLLQYLRGLAHNYDF